MLVLKLREEHDFRNKNKQNCHNNIKIENISKALVCRTKIKKIINNPVPNCKSD
jgi:hypothetical protein